MPRRLIATPPAVTILAFLSLLIVSNCFVFEIHAQGVGKALVLDGVDDYVDLGQNTAYEVGANFSLEARIYVERQTSYAGIICNILDSGINESGYGRMLDGESGVYFGLAVSSANIEYLSSGAETIALDTWHHIAATYDGSTHVRNGRCGDQRRKLEKRKFRVTNNEC